MGDKGIKSVYNEPTIHKQKNNNGTGPGFETRPRYIRVSIEKGPKKGRNRDETRQ
jgi:hypothetical protein